MTLSDLKTGMIVTTRNKCNYVVLKDTCLEGGEHDILLGIGVPGSWMALGAYNENMTCKKSGRDDNIARKFDIVIVKVPVHAADITLSSKNGKNVVWRRDESEINATESEAATSGDEEYNYIGGVIPVESQKHLEQLRRPEMIRKGVAWQNEYGKGHDAE